MTTSVTLTGTGTPIVVPGLAGPGVLVRHGPVAIQIDAGRGTVMRLGDLDVHLTTLSAVLVTHHHSDHMVGLADVLMTRWLEEVTTLEGQVPLPVVVPEGPAARIARHVLDVWEEEIQLRTAHTGRPDHPAPEVVAFDPMPAATEIYRVGQVVVDAVLVDHHPVEPAVGYRLTTPDGTVVVSGDTAISPALEELSADADVLVHEVFRRAAVEGLLSDPDAIAAYHSEARDVGALAARAGVRRLALTHLIPPVRTADDELAFVEDVRAGGFGGELVVGRDLSSITF